MERLTVKRKDGRWALANDDGAMPVEQVFKLPQAISRLAAYEDTGLEPEEVYGLCEMNKRSRMAKMLRWEEAERDGRLVVLPCKPGTTVYTTHWWDEVLETCTDSRGKKFRRVTTHHKVCKEPFSPFGLEYLNFGKTVFLTREEAEAAMAGKGEENA